MGTLNWTLTGANTPETVMSANDESSGAATTSTSEGAVSGFTPEVGQIAYMCADAAQWVRFGGRTAAVGTGFYLPANTPIWVKIDQGMGGAVSSIEIA